MRVSSRSHQYLIISVMLSLSSFKRDTSDRSEQDHVKIRILSLIEADRDWRETESVMHSLHMQQSVNAVFSISLILLYHCSCVKNQSLAVRALWQQQQQQQQQKRYCVSWVISSVLLALSVSAASDGNSDSDSAFTSESVSVSSDAESNAESNSLVVKNSEGSDTDQLFDSIRECTCEMTVWEWSVNVEIHSRDLSVITESQSMIRVIRWESSEMSVKSQSEDAAESLFTADECVSQPWSYLSSVCSELVMMLSYWTSIWITAAVLWTSSEMKVCEL